MRRHKNFDEARILTKAGIIKSLLTMLKILHQSCLTGKQTFLFIYADKFKCKYILHGRLLHHGMQQEAKIRLFLLDKHSKLIIDFLSILWLYKLGDSQNFILIKNPYQKIKIRESLMIQKYFIIDYDLKLRAIEKNRCMIFS